MDLAVEHANIFHHNSIIGASHMIVDDHNTSGSTPAQVVYSPSHSMFKQLVHNYIGLYRPLLQTMEQPRAT